MNSHSCIALLSHAHAHAFTKTAAVHKTSRFSPAVAVERNAKPSMRTTITNQMDTTTSRQLSRRPYTLLSPGGRRTHTLLVPVSPSFCAFGSSRSSPRVALSEQRDGAQFVPIWDHPLSEADRTNGAPGLITGTLPAPTAKSAVARVIYLHLKIITSQNAFARPSAAAPSMRPEHSSHVHEKEMTRPCVYKCVLVMLRNDPPATGASTPHLAPAGRCGCRRLSRVSRCNLPQSRRQRSKPYPTNFESAV